MYRKGKNMIYQAIEKAEQFLTLNQSCLHGIQNYSILFNKQKEPYIGVEESNFNNTGEILYKTIKLFELNNIKNLASLHSFDAMLSYEMNHANNQFSLNAIFVKRDHASKGLGAQLFGLLIMGAQQLKASEILGYLQPFDHGTFDNKKVFDFYEKLNFNPENGLNLYQPIKKQISDLDIKETKLRLIRFPAKKHEFDVYIPDKFLESTCIKNNDREM